MCGITGFINFNGHDQAAARTRIKLMADTLIHRGPDEEGFFVDNHAALGHRRLSIIDLAGGRQPMGVLNDQVQIVFNGEIYNFQVLRKELESKGYVFTTSSDTEVILNAYLEWGDDCPEKLSGMFAFAIWDIRNRKVFIARDRVGKKPLYYYWDGNCLAFASEIKALKAGGFDPGEIDPGALDCYFTFGYIPAPMSIFKNIRKLRAAHSLTIKDNSLRENRYWSLSYAEQLNCTLDEAVEELDYILGNAVESRLISEVPLGAFLSGGLDSTLVVSYMSQQLDKPVVTNSIGFGVKEFNELPVAKTVADYLNTNHNEFNVEPKAAEVLEKIAWHFDEPFADSSAVPTWYVCRMARQNVTVALSGDGGDEGFGGYTFRYVPHMYESGIRSKLPAIFRSPVFGSIGAIYPGSAKLPKVLRLKTIFENLAVSDSGAFYRDLAFLRMDAREDIYENDFMKSLNGFTPFETVYPLYNGSDARDPLGRSQHTDIQFYMTDDVLVKVDRMSMAHSLEVRSPLLDHRVLEFAARLPGFFKIKKGAGKIPLRKLAARKLPSDVLDQPKRGFSIPAAKWLREELKPIAEDAMFNGNGLTYNVLKKRKLKDMWQEHQSGARDHSVFIWGLMMLGLWEQNYY